MLFEFVAQNMQTGEVGRKKTMTRSAATRRNKELRQNGATYRWVEKANASAEHWRIKE